MMLMLMTLRAIILKILMVNSEDDIIGGFPWVA